MAPMGTAAAFRRLAMSRNGRYRVIALAAALALVSAGAVFSGGTQETSKGAGPVTSVVCRSLWAVVLRLPRPDDPKDEKISFKWFHRIL